MQGATKEEKHASLDAFLLGDMPEQNIVILDRSTLERAATCPFQTAAIEQGRVCNSSLITAAGQEVHEAISQTIKDWIDSRGAYNPTEVRDSLAGNLYASRPDVQPAAIKAVRRSIYDIANKIYEISPENILAFDGGEDYGKSGQLSIDVEPNFRVTTELDLLYQGKSPELLEELDWKSGHKLYSVEDVADSFQFNLHALVAFEKYPDPEGLRVKIWNTRTNRQTFSVIFYREEMGPFSIRLRKAIEVYETEVRGPNPACWPAVEKCCQCDAAAICPVSGTPILEIATDPAGAVRKLAALKAKVDAWETLLEAQVDHQGHDIIDGDIAYGRSKPQTRRATAAIYTPSKDNSDGQSDEAE